MIGKKLFKGKYTNKEYATTAIWCNKNNACLKDKGEYYEVVENTIPQPTLQEKLEQLETKYNMPRVIREIILANPDAYSEYNVLRARELEELAEDIRKKGK